MITGNCARCGDLDDLNNSELCYFCACSICGEDHDDEPCDLDLDEEDEW
ncbi:hypothetical protein [Actinocorallia longicatena]|uniref:Uncharacterized protein n=1 Tax=Actinocorallia longicatena TaxID=111803 RepID=A0ABP6QAB0_9ACTN